MVGQQASHYPVILGVLFHRDEYFTKVVQDGLVSLSVHEEEAGTALLTASWIVDVGPPLK